MISRKVTFRAWDSKYRMIRLDVAVFSNGRFRYMNLHDDDVMNSKDDILMQFTGLKDKNGKDIYEGDIVKYDKPYEVIWAKGRVGFWICNGTDCREFGINDNIEVIGNIYENPEKIDVVEKEDVA